MTTTNNGYAAIARDVRSLGELADEFSGSPALLLVYPAEDIEVGGDVESFFRSAPFFTAIVSNGGVPAEVASRFDAELSPEEAEEIPEKLYKDKSAAQIGAINAIFAAARKGASQKELLDMESRAFYRLMAEKNGGAK